VIGSSVNDGANAGWKIARRCPDEHGYLMLESLDEPMQRNGFSNKERRPPQHPSHAVMDETFWLVAAPRVEEHPCDESQGRKRYHTSNQHFHSPCHDASGMR
jgi:hypothetical protein